MSAPLTSPFDVLSPAELDDLLPQGLIFLGYRGSIAHGMFVPKNDPQSIDDRDLMGVYIAGMEHYFGFGRPEVHERFIGEWDSVSYELRKLFLLLLKGNPNVLSLLWLDPKFVLRTSAIWNQIQERRDLFVSKAVYHSFTGYAYGQLKKMTAFGEEQQCYFRKVEGQLDRRGIDRAWAASADLHDIAPTPSDTTVGDALAQMNRHDLVAHYQKLRQKYFSGYMGEKRKTLVTQHGYDTKNAAHCIRLLRMNLEFLQTGAMQVERPDAQELLEIKTGAWTIEQVQQEAQRLLVLSEEVFAVSALPDEPDRAAAEALLIELLSEYQYPG